MLKFLTFGETLIQRNADYIGPYDPEGSYTRHVAGAESNVALDIRKLLPNRVGATWVSRLGADADGDMILEQLRGRVEVAAPQVSGQNTGIQILNHLGGGEVTRRYRRAGSAASRLSADEVLPHLDGSDLVHVTGITPALSETCERATLSIMCLARERGIPVSMDVNYREALWSPRAARKVCERMLRYASLFKVGHDEAETIWGGGLSAEEFAKKFRRGGTLVTVVTTGERGAAAYDGASLVRHDGFSVDVIDPVGAGDAFVAGFLAGIFERHTMTGFFAMGADERASVMRDALELGNACGALVCTRHGDTEPMPSLNEARAFARGRTDGGQHLKTLDESPTAPLS